MVSEWKCIGAGSDPGTEFSSVILERKLHRYFPRRGRLTRGEDVRRGYKYHTSRASSRINQTFSKSHCTNCVQVSNTIRRSTFAAANFLVSKEKKINDESTNNYQQLFYKKKKKKKKKNGDITARRRDSLISFDTFEKWPRKHFLSASSPVSAFSGPFSLLSVSPSYPARLVTRIHIRGRGAWLIFPRKWMTLAAIPCARVPFIPSLLLRRHRATGTLASAISQE